MTEELKEWQYKVRCRKCDDVIYSRYSGEFVSCKCGAIFVDQTEWYGRYGGNSEDFDRMEQPIDRNV